MTGPGALTVPNVTSRTRPSTALSATVGSVIASDWLAWGLFDAIYHPNLRGVVYAHGDDFQRHVIDGSAYVTGLLAPSTAVTAASTAVRATSVITFTGNPANNDLIQVGRAGPYMGAGYITFKTTLDVTSTGDQVLRGANAAATIVNLAAFLNGTGTQGTEYWSGRAAFNGDSDVRWASEQDIECSASDATTLTIRARTYGTIGNTYIAREVTDSGGAYSFTGTVLSGGTAGTGTAPESGIYRYSRAYFRTADQARSAISPTTEIQLGSNANVNLTSFTDAPTRDGVDCETWYRTTVGGGDPFFKGKDVLASGSEPYVDNLTDDTLATTAFAFTYDPTLYRTYEAGYPTWFRYLTLYQGSLLGIGAHLRGQESQPDGGTTTSSATVTNTSPWLTTTNMIGKWFKVTGDPLDYLIVNVNPATGDITLHQAYQGTTDATAAYTVTDKRDPAEVYWTPPTIPNNWPFAYSQTGIRSFDSSGGTAIRAAFESVAAWTRTNLFRLVGSPTSAFRVQPVGNGNGAFCGQAVVFAEGACYWLGPNGAFRWNGDGDPRSISNPEVTGDSPRGIAGTLARINDDISDGIVGVYNPTKKIIRWFVPLDGEPWNNYALVYDLQTGAWTEETREGVTYAAVVVSPTDGTYRTITGDMWGNLKEIDVGTWDGAFGFEPVQAVSSYSAALRTVTVSGTPYPTSAGGLAGLPVWHIPAATGEPQRGIIASNTSSVLTLVHPFTTAPTALDQIIVGEIPVDLQGTRFDFGAPEMEKIVSSITLSYTPFDTGRLWVAVGKDSDEPTFYTCRDAAAVDYGSVANTDGEYQFMFWRGTCRRAMLRILALGCGDGFEVHSINPVVDVMDLNVE